MKSLDFWVKQDHSTSYKKKLWWLIYSLANSGNFLLVRTTVFFQDALWLSDMIEEEGDRDEEDRHDEDDGLENNAETESDQDFIQAA